MDRTPEERGNEAMKNKFGITTIMAIVEKPNGFRFSVPTFQLERMEKAGSLVGCKIENSRPSQPDRNGTLDEQFWRKDA